MQEQTCTICSETKPVEQFYFRKDNGRFRLQCKVCWNKRTQEWVKKNPEARKRHCKTWEENNPENVQIRKAAFRKRHPIEYRRWNLDNPELVKAINAAWAAKNKDKRAATAANRRARLLKATPPWSDLKEIASIYAKAAELKMEVDHILPLKHHLVCGLHVPNNLQLLSMNDNRRKSNKFAIAA